MRSLTPFCQDLKDDLLKQDEVSDVAIFGLRLLCH